MLFMLTKQIYKKGKICNLHIKYNLEYSKQNILNYECATHIEELLEEKYPLNSEQRSELTVLLNNLTVL